jgi:beta-phosphoglucomutase-like phosphatase (HAD superfamily)
MEIADYFEADLSAIIFDCDGTLVDSIPAHLKAFQTALLQQGHRMPAAWFYQHHSMPADSLLQKFQEDGLGQISNPELVLADHQKFFGDNLDLIEEISVITAVARKWTGRIPMGVASNGHRANVEASLQSKQLLNCFDVVVTREDVQRGKPFPDLYIETARQLNVSPEHCLVFEDSETGLQAATAAGARVIDVRHWHSPAWSQVQGK